MTREEAKTMLPIIQAYAEGKEIEIFDKTTKMWRTAMLPHFDCDTKNYRIKPESKYRSFKNAEECWTEMQKHQPFGVVKDKYFANYQIHRAFTCLSTNGCDFGGYEDETFESCFKNLLFADGTPFGVKVEE